MADRTNEILEAARAKERRIDAALAAIEVLTPDEAAFVYAKLEKRILESRTAPSATGAGVSPAAAPQEPLVPPQVRQVAQAKPENLDSRSAFPDSQDQTHVHEPGPPPTITRLITEVLAASAPLTAGQIADAVARIRPVKKRSITGELLLMYQRNEVERASWAGQYPQYALPRRSAGITASPIVPHPMQAPPADEPAREGAQAGVPGKLRSTTPVIRTDTLDPNASFTERAEALIRLNPQGLRSSEIGRAIGQGSGSINVTLTLLLAQGRVARHGHRTRTLWTIPGVVPVPRIVNVDDAILQVLDQGTKSARELKTEVIALMKKATGQEVRPVSVASRLSRLLAAGSIIQNGADEHGPRYALPQSESDETENDSDGEEEEDPPPIIN